MIIEKNTFPASKVHLHGAAQPALNVNTETAVKDFSLEKT